MEVGGPATRIFWDDRFLRYDLGASHPFQESYRRLAVRLFESMNRDGSGPRVPVTRVAEFEPAARPDLERFHKAEYLDFGEASGPAPGRVPLDAGATPS